MKSLKHVSAPVGATVLSILHRYFSDLAASERTVLSIKFRGAIL